MEHNNQEKRMDRCIDWLTAANLIDFKGHMCSSKPTETNRNNHLCHFSELILSHLRIVMQWNTHTPLTAPDSDSQQLTMRRRRGEEAWHLLTLPPCGGDKTGYLQGRWESGGGLDPDQEAAG